MRFALCLLLAVTLPGCVTYEFDHEIWLRVDGSGSLSVAGLPSLWAAFKGASTPAEARALFERSGLSVRRAALTRRAGRPCLVVSADFDDLSRLRGTPAFPDLRLALSKDGERLRLDGTWGRPAGTPDPPAADRRGVVGVRFHLPSRVYEQKNAFSGVERGNIVVWRMDVADALRGGTLAMGATLDARSILGSTVGVFGAAIAGAMAILGGALALVVRKGRRPRPAA